MLKLFLRQYCHTVCYIISYSSVTYIEMMQLFIHTDEIQIEPIMRYAKTW